MAHLVMLEQLGLALVALPALGAGEGLHGRVDILQHAEAELGYRIIFRFVLTKFDNTYW